MTRSGALGRRDHLPKPWYFHVRVIARELVNTGRIQLKWSEEIRRIWHYIYVARALYLDRNYLREEREWYHPMCYLFVRDGNIDRLLRWFDRQRRSGYNRDTQTQRSYIFHGDQSGLSQGFRRRSQWNEVKSVGVCFTLSFSLEDIAVDIKGFFCYGWLFNRHELDIRHTMERSDDHRSTETYPIDFTSLSIVSRTTKSSGSYIGRAKIEVSIAPSWRIRWPEDEREEETPNGSDIWTISTLCCIQLRMF